MIKTILVIGATGMLGFPVARTLNEAGFRVRVHSRDIYKLKMMFGNEYDFHFCDVNDDKLLEYAFEDCYGVYISLSGGISPKNCELVEDEGVKNIVETAKRQGVKKISLISRASVQEGAAGDPEIRIKLQAEKYVAESGIDYTIFRPSLFMESLSYYVKKREAFIIGDLKTEFSWVAAQDYADIVAQSFLFEQASNKTFYVYGHEKLTMEEALKKFVNRIIPDVEIKKISSEQARLKEDLFRKKYLLRMIESLEYCEKLGLNPENGRDTDTQKLFTTKMSTFDEWLNNYTPPIYTHTPWKR